MILQVGVKVLIKDDQERFLFIRRSVAFKAGPQKWDIPGGRINPDESLVDALHREVREETNLEFGGVERLLLAQDIFASDKDLHVVRLTFIGSASGDITISDEHDAYRWMTVSEVLSEVHVDTYLREVLEQF